MKIGIQQCLHGYLDGHQLMASSADLSPAAKRTMLFQSDLSGPKFTSGFESYLTGYPLADSSYYVLAKTWYADEMPRPGCVWTHSLLIEYADLGKIPELGSLLSLFQRPTNNNYRNFEQELSIEFGELFKGYQDTRPDDYDSIAREIYTRPSQSVIIESQNSERYEKVILEIWSDQWPRLRRNFLFCSGALSLKSIGSRFFDVQVIPAKSKLSISRESQNLAFVDFKDVDRPSWLTTIHSTSKDQLRQFLWLFGADMLGERANFPKLVELYASLNVKEANILDFNHLLKEALPKAENGKAFKNSIFGSKRTFNQFSEMEILSFLIHEHNLEHLDIEDYNITSRLVNLYVHGKIGLSKYVNLIETAESNRIDESVFDVIKIEPYEAPELFQTYNSLIGKLLSRNLDVAFSKELWLTDLYTQRTILTELIKIYSTLPVETVHNILLAQSEIIFDINRHYGSIIVEQSLAWYNKDLNELLGSWRDFIFHKCFNIFIDWFRHSLGDLHPKVFIDVFQKSNADWVFNLPLDYNEWVHSYNTLSRAQLVDLPYVSSLFISKGLQSRLYGCEWLVTAAFNDVYKFAERSQLSRHWDIIPKDLEAEERQEDFNPVELVFNFFGFGTAKKRRDVQHWDYCEMLIRTVSNKYFKNNWSTQSYLDTFNLPDTFRRSAIFMSNKRKGFEYLSRVKNCLIVSKSINGRSFQIKLMSEF